MPWTGWTISSRFHTSNHHISQLPGSPRQTPLRDLTGVEMWNSVSLFRFFVLTISCSWICVFTFHQSCPMTTFYVMLTTSINRVCHCLQVLHTTLNIKNSILHESSLAMCNTSLRFFLFIHFCCCWLQLDFDLIS